MLEELEEDLGFRDQHDALGHLRPVIEPHTPQELVLASVLDLARLDSREVPFRVTDLAFEHAPRHAS
jgi:hypothetical protein